jgi:cytochrome P450
MPRQADVDIEICGTVIPKGTIITLFPSVIQLNKTIWGPTADQFDPDRWTNLPETAKSPWALLTFYGGPRGCIGKGYAVLEIKVMLTRLVREFKFAPGQKSFELLKEGHVYKPVGGLKMKIRPVP